MDIVNNIIKWMQKWLPGIWSILLVIIITSLLLSGTIGCIQYLLHLMGVC